MTTKTDTEQLRAEFEAHFSRPPFEWEFHRYGEDSAWPGNYQLYEHQCAWEAYQAGRAAGIRDGRAAAYDTASRMEQMREDGL